MEEERNTFTTARRLRQPVTVVVSQAAMRGLLYKSSQPARIPSHRHHQNTGRARGAALRNRADAICVAVPRLWQMWPLTGREQFTFRWIVAGIAITNGLHAKSS